MSTNSIQPKNNTHGIQLVAVLPRDRKRPGIITAYSADTSLATWQCLGKADNAQAERMGNKERNPLLRFGDTPTGLWRASRGKRFDDTHTYGIHQVITLWPLSGDAVVAYSLRLPDGRAKKRRDGIWLHGGALRDGRLRPTYGCLRVSDDAMAAIWRLVERHGPLTTLEVIEQ